MADIPLFPDENNLDTFRDFVNVQKEMLDLLMAQKKEYEQIGRINLSIEKKVVQRRQAEKRMMQEIQAKIIEHEAQKKISIEATGDAARERANQLLKSLEKEISDTKTLLAMSREASNIEMEMAKRRYDDEHKWFGFASAQAKNLLGLKVKEFELTKGIGDELIKLGVRGEIFANTLAATLMMLKGAYDLFIKFDKAAWDFRKAMGMTRAESAGIQKSAQRIAIDYMHIGVTVESAYKSYQALGKSMGGVHNVSAGLVKDVAVMAAQLGISEETSARFLRNLASVSKSSMESQSNMMYMAQAMSSAAGVQLSDVMGDVATKSTKTLTMMSRLPNVALRTAIELRRMGTDINKAADSSRHILDFTESVNEEMEASVLLGRGINLQRARELSYRRDLVESTKEILRITKQVNFEQLDTFQQEAYAKATGKTVDELLNMLQADRQIEQIKRRGTTEQRAQLALYEKMSKENVAAAKARAKDVGIMIQAKANQERITAITAKWNQLLAKAQEWLLPIVDRMLDLVLPAMDIGMAIAKWSFVLLAPLKALQMIGTVVANLGVWLAIASMKSAKLGNLFLKISSVGTMLTGPWNRVVALVGMALGKLGFFGKFLGFFGKLLGPIGWVITAFQAIGGFIKGWNSTTGNWIQKLGGGVMGALRNIIPGFDWIVKAVKWVWGWISKATTSLFGWFNPIQWAIDGFKIIKTYLGQMWEGLKYVGELLMKGAQIYYSMWAWAIEKVWGGIKFLYNSFVDGIKAVGGLILDALLWPYKTAWNWIKSLWGGSSPSQIGLSILKGIASVGPMIFDALTAPFRKGIAWIADKIPGMGKFADKLRGGAQGMAKPVENRAQAAYIPAVTVTPKGTEIAKAKDSAKRAGEKEKEESELMSEETGQKICSLLEKILAKDSNISMDGQLLSTHLARQTEFRGGYGVNKVA